MSGARWASAGELPPADERHLLAVDDLPNPHVQLVFAMLTRRFPAWLLKAALGISR